MIINAKQNPQNMTIDFYVSDKFQNEVTNVMVTTQPRTENVDMAFPSFQLPYDDAQALMDSLWDAGIKPRWIGIDDRHR